MIQKLAIIFTALIALSACSGEPSASPNDAVLSPAESTTSTVPRTVPPTACSVGEWADTGLLAINASWDGDYELFVFDLASKEVERLTDNDVVDRWPKWSPDGREILFFSDRDGDYEVFVMDYNTRVVKQLTDNDAMDGFASWSPDGTRIAFGSARDGDWEIFVAKADGTDPQQLTFNEVDDHTPVWSPEGDRLAFNSYRDGGYAMWMMNADGSAQEIIQLGTSAGFPVWATSGEKIAFNTAAKGNRAVGIVDLAASGSAEPYLQVFAFAGGWPVWSSDGDRLAFSSAMCGGEKVIFLVDSDGTGLTATGVIGEAISWRN
jgi:Tol biopolymer transport system component